MRNADPAGRLVRALADGIGTEVLTVLTRFGAAAADAAKRRAPVRTGRLRDSIGYRIAGGDIGSGETAEAVVGTDVPYAAAQELGTSKIRGKHFLADGTAAGAAEVFGGK